jgi:hypothetical protein
MIDDESRLASVFRQRGLGGADLAALRSTRAFIAAGGFAAPRVRSRRLTAFASLGMVLATLAVAAYVLATRLGAPLPRAVEPIPLPSAIASPSPEPTESPSASATPVPPPPAQITLSGAANGALTDIQVACDQHENIGAAYRAVSVAGNGVLNGHHVEIRIYDPAGPGSFEFAGYVEVTEILSGETAFFVNGHTAGRYESWVDRSPSAVSSFTPTRAVASATLEWSQQGSSGTIARRPLVLSGWLGCG